MTVLTGNLLPDVVPKAKHERVTLDIYTVILYSYFMSPIDAYPS